MKKLDVVLNNKIVRVLQQSAEKGNLTPTNAEAISKALLDKFYSQNPQDKKRCQNNAVLPSGLSEEFKRLAREDYQRLYLSLSLLTTLVFLTFVEFVLLSYSKVFVIPILFSSNLALILMGYVASEYKHISILERDHDLCLQNKAVIDDFHAFLQDYNVDEQSDMTKEDVCELLTMIDNLRIQARSNGYK